MTSAHRFLTLKLTACALGGALSCGAAGMLAGCSHGGTSTHGLGEACANNSECEDDAVCQDGVCRRLCYEPDGCPEGLGCRGGVCQRCSNADECPGHGWCDATGTCRRDCTVDVECNEGGYCGDAGLCVTSLPFMESCDRDRVCADGNCLDGTCCPSGCTTACSGEVCLLADGAACNNGDECDSGACVDRTCCAEACDGPCQTCYGAVPGVCEPIARGVDEACATTCRDGVCLGALGDGCTQSTQCESDFCADNYCCDAPCADECRSCAHSGREGECTAMISTEWESCSYGNDGARACDASGACSAPHLVLDINGLDGARDFVKLTSGAIVFSANAEGLGRELWVYDPAKAKAHLLQDIRIGPAGSDIRYLQPAQGCGTAARAIFVADNEANGRELWHTNGVTAGIIELTPGPGGSDPAGLAATQRDCDSKHLIANGSLWRWDDGSMRKVVDEAALFADGRAAFPGGPRLYFLSSTRSQGRELGWIDSAYPFPVTRLDTFAGRDNTDPSNLTITYPLIYLTATTSSNPYVAHSLYAVNWSTGSTPALVTGTCSGCTGGISTDELLQTSAALFCTGHDSNPLDQQARLWAVDFGTANTLKPVPLAAGASSMTAPRLLTAADDTLYLASNEGLWSTPTAYASVTATLKVPLAGGTGISAIYPAGEYVYFVADNGTHGVELWRLSVTLGTWRFLDIAAGSAGSEVHILGQLSNHDVYFVATNEAEGEALWYCSEDTFEMTDACKVLDPLPGPDSSLAFEAGERKSALIIDDTLIFAALAAHGGPYHLWRVGVDRVLTDLSVIGRGLASSSPSGYIDGFAPGEVLFAADDGIHGVELWTTDGTAEGTHLVRDVYQGSGSGAPSAMIRFGALLLLSLCTPGDGCELWSWDGDAGGPTLLKNLDTTPGVGTSPHDLTPFAGKVYFSAGGELWVTDGTANGTVLVKDINATGASNPERLRAVGSTLYFFADDGTHGKELWMSDGTTDGTVIVADTGTISDPALARDLAPCGDRICFTGADADHGAELWATNCVPGLACPVCHDAADCPDGCPAVGACLLGDLRAGAAVVSPPHQLLGTVGGLLFFKAYLDGSSPVYVTDGTTDGTRPFSDIDPTPPLDILPPFVVSGRQAYFLAPDDELWATNGKDAWAVWSGGAIDAQVPFVAYRNRLYFSALADDAATSAAELFVTDGNASAAYPACADRTLCLNPKALAVARDRLWLSADTPVGRELVVFP